MGNKSSRQQPPLVQSDNGGTATITPFKEVTLEDALAQLDEHEHEKTVESSERYDEVYNDLMAKLEATKSEIPETGVQNCNEAVVLQSINDIDREIEHVSTMGEFSGRDLSDVGMLPPPPYSVTAPVNPVIYSHPTEIDKDQSSAPAAAVVTKRLSLSPIDNTSNTVVENKDHGGVFSFSSVVSAVFGSDPLETVELRSKMDRSKLGFIKKRQVLTYPQDAIRYINAEYNPSCIDTRIDESRLDRILKRVDRMIEVGELGREEPQVVSGNDRKESNVAGSRRGGNTSDVTSKVSKAHANTQESLSIVGKNVERLQQTEQKSADMANEAKNYRNNARSLVEAMKRKDKFWGFG